MVSVGAEVRFSIVHTKKTFLQGKVFFFLQSNDLCLSGSDRPLVRLPWLKPGAWLKPSSCVKESFRDRGAVAAPLMGENKVEGLKNDRADATGSKAARAAP
ncbi:hypothetical protein BS614_30790 (plasmid) [Paenibacillus xylanexedens]|nr:hypothetical protein BS614_30790 [Paenibacillus xylanexedens]